jgi:hypothetical protein
LFFLHTLAMHRRRFAQLLAAALTPLWACAAKETDVEAVVRLLGLQAAEQPWLASLDAAQLRDLRAALEHAEGPAVDRAVNLTFAAMGTRSRTFAFVGYPEVNDKRSLCDGLLSE